MTPIMLRITRAIPTAVPLILILILLCALTRGAVAARGQEPASPPPANGGSAEAATAANAEDREALMAEGQEIYSRDCYECHTDGGMGPTLNGRTWLSDKSRVLKILLHGGGDMPEFGPTLTDRELAAVATFVRNNWDNRFGVVTETDVKRARDAAEAERQ